MACVLSHLVCTWSLSKGKEVQCSQRARQRLLHVFVVALREADLAADAVTDLAHTSNSSDCASSLLGA